MIIVDPMLATGGSAVAAVDLSLDDCAGHWMIASYPYFSSKHLTRFSLYLSISLPFPCLCLSPCPCPCPSPCPCPCPCPSLCVYYS